MNKTPYKCHIFVCAYDRHGEKKACADENGSEIKVQLKQIMKAKGWSSKEVRVSQSMCLGNCSQGPVVMVYPQERMFTCVSINDVDRIADELHTMLTASQ